VGCGSKAKLKENARYGPSPKYNMINSYDDDDDDDDNDISIARSSQITDK